MGLQDNIMPEERLPPCWSDDVRMNALFAPFRLKTANPESWDMKMKFWSDMLRQWCKVKRDPMVSASDAKFVFQRKGRTPACLDIVLEEMLRNGELSPLSKYQQILHNGPEGWVRWGARLAFRPAAFALTAVTSLLPARQVLDNDGLPKASIDGTHRFVLESAVKDQATTLMETFPPGVERIGTIEELMKRYNWQQSKETFEVLLGWLVAQGSAVKKGDVVKLAEPNKKVSQITETDEALVKLSAAESRLLSDASRLEREATNAESEARANHALGNRTAAKNHLRRKHRALQRLEKCEGALDNVRQLLQQMRDVDVNATIVDTYRTSSQAMKKGMQDGGLEEDAVHNTMDDLKDVLESYNEVEKALANNTLDDFDAAELEAELKELLNPGPGTGGNVVKPGDVKSPLREKKPVTEPTPLLPSPPKHLPSARKTTEREFIFDGEARVIAELNELSDENLIAKRDKTPAKAKASKAWYPPASESLKDTWNNNPDFRELRQDERLHPGQPLNVDFTTPPRIYGADFAVRDHKMHSGVWLYNTDSNCNDLAASTDYSSTESPGKSGSTFGVPGGERKRSATKLSDVIKLTDVTDVNDVNDVNDVTEVNDVTSPIDDLERRLRDLRGFNL